ncbi:cytochrome c oxidase assembly protein COX20, mitochondrial-like [Homarus americanus]|uniref:Cytochrome c oxidase assembly protein COX20, mitochondrial n=1 Tax=Homarus americanus TaxID=6706 RepID=A0A8J5MNE2_HOMAM|nr:cytochrome c oxidase assembly protein COX20, mitochondrial-like [Homarus americanus]XP_042242006.1 cytochrome c oxidase assembly protein COX20, mitochondrial-like [Homarus americanus]XP_042242007.1 cytochrome c oxidase assembly protein COX20, mitochondrial-like [Homarus americanus]KAG7157928.1 Cytochrome c oxidase assembly protein COX20-like [Homarus americanus]
MAEPEKETKLLGRNLSQIPCFRETFLYSISSGLAAGLINFMLTSRVQRSAHLAFGVYGCVTIGYWSFCRYNFAKEKFNMGRLQNAMQKQALYEGTDMEKEIKRKD